MKGMNMRHELFPELGNIIASKNQYGRKRTFEINLDKGYQEDINKLWHFYGLSSEKINVMLPFDQMGKNFSTYYSAKANGVTIMHSDGKVINWLKDPISMLPLVSKQRALIPIPEWGIRTGDVVPYRKITQWGESMEVNTSRKAFLKVMLPELNELSYATLYLWQNHDIDSMVAYLSALENASCGQLTNIPMMLQFNDVPFQRNHGKFYKESVVINADCSHLNFDFDMDIYRSQLEEISTYGIFDQSYQNTQTVNQLEEESCYD